MTRKRKIIGVVSFGFAVLLILFLVISVSYNPLMCSTFAKVLLGGELDRPQIENWTKLKLGMTVSEVENMLGSNNAMRMQRGKPMYLEYGHTAGFLSSGPSPEAYVLFFDKNERLVQWRKPVEKSNNRVEQAQ